MNDIKIEQMKQQFNAKLATLISEKASNTGFLSKEKYLELVTEITQLKQKTTGKTPVDYQKLKRFDVVRLRQDEKLIYPVSDNSAIKYYVPTDELFNLIHETHLSFGHGGRNKMSKEINKKYKNVTVETIMIYLNLCEACQQKSNVLKKGSVVGPMPFNETNSRCQIDLISMQEDKGFTFILVYQDDLSKFIQLRPLKTKTAEEVASKLLDIFTIFGAPSVIQSDNGREFLNEVIEEVCAMWPELKIVDGKPRQSECRASAERTNEDVENMLKSWLETNQTTKWSDGLRFIQFMKNRAYHVEVRSSPYEAMFGHPVKLGLSTSDLSQEALQFLNTEEELEQLINGSDKDDSENFDVEYFSDKHEAFKEERGD